MKKSVCYEFTIPQAKKLLQNVLGDNSIELVPHDYFYEVAYNNGTMDGLEVDKCFAKALGLKKCSHSIGEDGEVVLVIDKSEEARENENMKSITEARSKVLLYNAVNLLIENYENIGYSYAEALSETCKELGMTASELEAIGIE